VNSSAAPTASAAAAKTTQANRERHSGRTYSAPAAACAADILLLLAHEPELALASIARSLKRSKTLTFRVVRELEQRELLQRTDHGSYRLGVAALEIGGAYASHASHAASAREGLRLLADATGETANLGVLRGPDVMCLINQEGHNVIGTVWSAGDRLPAHCTAIGKALLAPLAPDALRKQLGSPLRKLTPHSLSTYRQLEKELAQVRRQGFATAHGEAIYGLNAIAIVVRLPGRNSETAAMSISMSEDRFGARDRELLEALHQARARIERETAAFDHLAGRAAETA
jgi:IclR family KDG regulon transcriptional repressor